jgi:hypothetical protein
MYLCNFLKSVFGFRVEEIEAVMAAGRKEETVVIPQLEYNKAKK